MPAGRACLPAAAEKARLDWDRDGHALLRKHKPHCFGTRPLPSTIPFSDDLAAVIRTSR
jgi:hypothetical protein